MSIDVVEDAQGEGRTYLISGQVFFASADMLVDAFDVREIAARPVCIDVSQAHFWDVTAAGALRKVVDRLKKYGSPVEVVGLGAASQTMIDRMV